MSLPDKNHLRIAVASDSHGEYSQTFVREHLRLLKSVVRILSPAPRTEGSSSTHQAIMTRWTHKVLRKIWTVFTGDSSQTGLWAHQLKEIRADVVLAEFGYMGLAVWRACRLAEVPLVVHFHGADAYSSKALAHRVSEYPAMFEYASAVIGVSKDMMRQLKQIGVREKQLVCNPYGVDVDLFSPSDVSQSPPRFISVGRFVDKKAPYLTILAFHEVVRQVPEAELLMIGDGVLLEICGHITKALGLESRVRFLGVQTQEDICRHLKNSRCFVQHSITTQDGDAEGAPVALMEASAAGLPVISTFHGGINEIVVDGQTGFLVCEKDIHGMAEKMIRLAKDPLLAQQMGERGRQHIAEHFNIKQSISNLQGILTRVAKKGLAHG